MRGSGAAALPLSSLISSVGWQFDTSLLAYRSPAAAAAVMPSDTKPRRPPAYCTALLPALAVTGGRAHNLVTQVALQLFKAKPTSLLCLSGPLLLGGCFLLYIVTCRCGWWPYARAGCIWCIGIAFMLAILCSFFHFIRRFWNQILICRSVRQSACAISILCSSVQCSE